MPAGTASEPVCSTPQHAGGHDLYLHGFSMADNDTDYFGKGDDRDIKRLGLYSWMIIKSVMKKYMGKN